MGKVKGRNQIKRKWRGVRFGAILAGSLLVMALPALSQNCALCYTQAASAGARMIAALKSGILVLIIPPTLASIGMIFVVHHKRNQVRGPDDDGKSGQDW